MTRGRRVVSIVGATGLVGSETVRTLFARQFPLKELRLFSSGRTAQHKIAISGKHCEIQPFSLGRVKGSQICFLAAGSGFSKRYARRIASLDSVVIDNSSAFRMEKDVPLVVPEVNSHDIVRHKGIIANPNCSTIQMVVVLAPLHELWRLRKVIVSTYQSVSGAGLRAMAELATQSYAALEGRLVLPREFTHRIAFNLIPGIGRFDREGWAVEETKLMNETKKILGDTSIDIVATAVRVPVFRCHSESVYAEFAKEVDLRTARRMLENAPGIVVLDSRSGNGYPVPLDCAGSGEIFVGRLRRDLCSTRGLSMWIVSDNLRKGAALNAVQIAEELI